ncbi:MAG: metallophosphoesterase [Endomicrobia bacterium]|nr:metallophosphoesterase [Endomicrobiia bacterium]
MLIGVISDTHDNIGSIKRAVKVFNLRSVDLVLHCGDIFSFSAAKEFAALNCGFKAVFGNNDFDRAGLENVISEFGMIQEAPFEFKVSGKLFVMVHKAFNIGAMATDGRHGDVHDYVLYGHTHKPSLEKQGKTAILNPGEACGERYGKKTAAVINLDSDSVEFIDLDF